MGAQLCNNGELVFHGQDIGPGVEKVFGFVEYEWSWTRKKQDVSKLEKVIGENILSQQIHIENNKSRFLGS